MGEGATLVPRKSRLGVMDGRRARVKERVHVERFNDGGDGVFVDLFNCVAVGGVKHDTIGEERVDDVRVLGGERVLHATWAGSGGDDGVRRMRGTQSGGQELGAEHVGVLSDRHLHHFLVEM